MRLNSTAIDVHHDGDADKSKYVNVTYYKDGKVKKIKVSQVNRFKSFHF